MSSWPQLDGSTLHCGLPSLLGVLAGAPGQLLDLKGKSKLLATLWAGQIPCNITSPVHSLVPGVLIQVSGTKRAETLRVAEMPPCTSLGNTACDGRTAKMTEKREVVIVKHTL